MKQIIEGVCREEPFRRSRELPRASPKWYPVTASDPTARVPVSIRGHNSLSEKVQDGEAASIICKPDQWVHGAFPSKQASYF